MVFESMRLQTVHLVNVHLKRGHQIRKLTRLMTFPWDEPISEYTKNPKKQTMEEMKEIMLKFAERQNKAIKKT
jgi:hypothetical protein